MTRSEALAAAFRGKTVLITGHTGFKGSWLALWLSMMGAKVVGFADGVPTDPSHFVRLSLNIEERIGDVCDGPAVLDAVQAIRPDIIFHLAAQSLVRRAYSDPAGTYRTNVIGSLNVFEAARIAGSVRGIVSATTDKVYRNQEWEWGYRETDPLGGADPYSASKSCVELLTDSYRVSFLQGSGLLIASVRAGNVLGGGDWAEDRLVPDIFRAIYADRPVAVRNPASTRPWQHVLDPLYGYLLVGARLLNGDAAAADAWNFGPVRQSFASVADILAAMQAQLPHLRIANEPDAQGRHESRLLALDSSRAVARLDWLPVWENEILERTIDWYRAFYERDHLLSSEQVSAYLRRLDGRA